MKSPESSPLQQPQQPLQEPISPEEAEAVKKDMFMTGRAIRVGQTMEEYRAEGEKLWEAKKQRKNKEKEVEGERNENPASAQKQAERRVVDQTKANEIRRALGVPEKPVGSTEVPVVEKRTESKQEAGAEGGVYAELEKFKTLPNIDQGLRALEKRLAEPEPNWEGVQRVLYEMLTNRSEYAKLYAEHHGDASEVFKQFSSERKEYKEYLDTTLPQWVDQSGAFKWESNPAWFGINTRPEARKERGINMKAYLTIPSSEYMFIRHIPELAQELRTLAISSDDSIKVKIPANFSGFFSRNDSIVVHYKKVENGSAVQAILDRWMHSSNILEEPREMGRTKIAADSKESSFSELIAKNISGWVKEQHGKYESNLLAKLAVEYAIEQSQKPPTIEKS